MTSKSSTSLNEETEFNCWKLSLENVLRLLSWCFLHHISRIPIDLDRVHRIVHIILIHCRWMLRIKARRRRCRVNERLRRLNRIPWRIITSLRHTFLRHSLVSIRWQSRWSNDNVFRLLMHRSSVFHRVQGTCRATFFRKISSLIWTRLQRWALLWCNANIFLIRCERLTRNKFSRRKSPPKNRRQSVLKWPHRPARIRRPRRHHHRRNRLTSNVWNLRRLRRYQPSIRKALANQNRSRSRARHWRHLLLSSAGVVSSLRVCVCVIVFISCYFLSPWTSLTSIFRWSIRVK